LRGGGDLIFFNAASRSIRLFSFGFCMVSFSNLPAINVFSPEDARSYEVNVKQPSATLGECDGLLTIGTPGQISFSSDFPNLPSSFKIAGTFWIVGTVNWSGKTVKMDEGAEIYIPTSAQLVLTNGTIVEGCDKMWRGIRMAPFSYFGAFDGSEVNDAEIAVFANNFFNGQSCEIELQRCTFRRNFKGVSIIPANNQQLVFTTLYMEDVSFVGTGPLKTPYTGQNPANYGARTEIGVELHRVTNTTVGGSPGTCTFNDMNFGVWADKSFFKVRECDFLDMASSTLGGNQGTGIYAQNLGYPDIQTCNFERCTQGVSMFRTNFLISENNFSQLWLGMYIRESEFSFFPSVVLPTIFDNEISDVMHGIYLLNNGDANVQVEKNIVLKVGGFGIRVTDNPNIPCRSYIVNNEVSLEGGYSYPSFPFAVNKTGIELVTTNNAAVCSNQVRIASNAASNTCIVTNGGRTHTITNNYPEMATSLASNDFQTAMSVNMTSSTKLHCNFPLNTARGLNVSGACAMTTFKTNEFDNHGLFGMRYTSTAAVGLQFHHGNTWAYANGLSNPGATFDGLSIIGQQYVVDCNENPDFCPTITGAPGWFINQNNPDQTVTCTPGQSICTEPIPFTGGGEGEEFIGRIIDGDMDFGDYTAGTQWMLDQQAIRWIRENNLESTGDYATYAAAQSGSSAEQIIDMEASVEQWMAQRASDRAQMAQLWDSMMVILSLYSLASQDYAQFETMRQQLDSLREAFHDDFKTLLNQIEQDNSSLSDTHVYEENFKDVQQIWLEAYGRVDGEWTSQEKAALEAIANQCPDEGGVAVLWARGLLYASDEAYSFDDESICNTGARVTNVFETAPSMLAIQPNPTDGLVHVTLPQEGTYHARIFNSIGSLVQEQNLNGGQQTIRFKQGLSAGAYWIRIDGKSSEFSAQAKVVFNR